MNTSYRLPVASFILGVLLMISPAQPEENATEKTSNKSSSKPEVRTATFGLGWFWTSDAQFGGLKGVIRTRVGYAGGTKSNPTYRAMGDHTEVVQVEYHPDVIEYDELLDVFWSHHDPGSQAWKRQYWNAIFYENDHQKKRAEASLSEVRKENKGEVQTKLLPIRSFTRAEQYHQKYYLQQNRDLVRKLKQPYPDAKTFLDSPVATRANAFVAREITEEELRNYLNNTSFSTLSPENLERSEAILCGKNK